MTNELGERRDLKEELESEEYQAMCQKIREEWWPMTIDQLSIHREAMRRLKDKYEQA
jgi:hypothetical protein